MDLFARTVARPAPARVEQPSAAPSAPVTPAPSAPAPALAPSRQETLERARKLASEIAACLGPGFKVLLTVHDNRSTMVSFRRQPPMLKIRAHHMFLDAPPEVVRAIADYAGHGRTAAGRVLDDYIAARNGTIAVLPRKPSPLESRGKCFDLQELFNAVNAAHFENSITARIGWGRDTTGRRRRSIRLGVYDHKSREIRLHPALDRPDVPRYFVEFIIFHEMLHQVFPSARDSGRHVHHPKAFRDRERTFPRFELAMAWEKQNLKSLLSR